MTNNQTSTSIIISYKEAEINIGLKIGEIARKRAMLSKIMEVVEDADPEEEIGVLFSGIESTGKKELSRLLDEVIQSCERVKAKL